MKKVNFCLTFLLTVLMSVVGAKASAHDIEAVNADGVTIYYVWNVWNSDTTELSVSWRESLVESSDDDYSGNVVIPSSVTYDGKEYSVTGIYFGAFLECSSLTSVTIPNSVTSIGMYAFYGCSDLTKIVVASGNTTYDSRNDCNAIIETASNTLIAGCQNTIIPNSVTSIGNHAFDGCSGLTSVEIPNSVTSIGDYAFLDCSGLTSVEIPNSVTSIGNRAFRKCSSLTSVTIGSSVTSIGTYIFYDWKALTKLICLATTPPQCAAKTFNGIDKENCTLIVPAGSIDDYKAADQWKDFLIVEEAPSGINQTHLDNALPVRQYDASGSRIAAPQRGINIIKSSDGTTKKVLVK